MNAYHQFEEKEKGTLIFEFEKKARTKLSFPKLLDYTNQTPQYNYSRKLEPGNWLIIYT